MANIEQHCQDCKRLLGDRFENVNRWMDELFALKGPGHRRFRHHWDGVSKARELVLSPSLLQQVSDAAHSNSE